MMRSMMRSTGTFVNRDSTSNEAMTPLLSLVLRVSRNSDSNHREYVVGM
ncbi:hypothetical protein E2C01_099838 [Portunus trituberculatus]|uniref:Uncharacterized protein n=1 Tax=Portunus trituberculatus TaxID=210409 RepID=A0A5B7KHU9_PORTR|nr:hypothetical protein [Portunus trituberculatus]